MQAELKDLWKIKRPEVTRKVAEAAAMGDRSENAEYIYGKKQLREMDSRIRYLSKRLDALVVVDRPPPDQDKVYFGAWVTVAAANAAEQTFRLVGPDEFDRETAFISVDSPMARALLGKRPGDEVDVHDRHYVIVRIAYEGGP
jgi:transcription elongation factor GreB